jgi:hypothetical protein
MVFVENSGSDLTPIHLLCERLRGAKVVELISFYGLDYPALYGRGQGEFRLLDHALTHSRILSGLGTHETWWEVTGRLRVRNLDRLIRTAPESYDLYADFRPRKRHADLRLLSFSRGGYERWFRGYYRELTGTPAEEHFYERFARHGGSPSAPMIVPEFRGTKGSPVGGTRTTPARSTD